MRYVIAAIVVALVSSAWIYAIYRWLVSRVESRTRAELEATQAKAAVEIEAELAKRDRKIDALADAQLAERLAKEPTGAEVRALLERSRGRR